MFVWFVVTLHVREMLTFCTHCRCAKWNPRYTLLNLNSSLSAFLCVCVRDSPLVRIKQSFCCCCTNVFFSYLYLIRYETTLIWLKFYNDVCSLKSNCHACIFCLLYGVFEIFINKIILSERYVCMRYKREPQAHAGMFFFFLCVGECVCMPNKKLHIFNAF